MIPFLKLGSNSNPNTKTKEANQTFVDHHSLMKKSECRCVEVISLDIPFITVASLHTVGYECRVPLQVEVLRLFRRSTHTQATACCSDFTCFARCSSSWQLEGGGQSKQVHDNLGRKTKSFLRLLQTTCIFSNRETNVFAAQGSSACRASPAETRSLAPKLPGQLMALHTGKGQTG